MIPENGIPNILMHPLRPFTSLYVYSHLLKDTFHITFAASPPSSLSPRNLAARPTTAHLGTANCNGRSIPEYSLTFP